MNIDMSEIGTELQLKAPALTTGDLKQVLEAFLYNCEILPREVLCIEGLEFPRPVFITIDPEQSLITLEVYDWPPPYADRKDLADMLNALNAQVGFGTFYMAKGNLHGQYSFTYSDGLNVKHFIENVRRLSRIYDTAVANALERKALN
jgi:hypothetical protein